MREETKSMAEAELKLMLLRYNMLSKERAEAAYMWSLTGKSAYEKTRWLEYVGEMEKISNELRSYGYDLVCTGIKTTSKTQYRVYKIVHVHSN